MWDETIRLNNYTATEAAAVPPTSRPPPIPREGRIPKYKRILYAVAGLSVFVFILNTAFLIYVLTGNRSNNGKGTLYSSSCPNIRAANTGIHLLINILSTMLLGASNYCMQCLSAPAREETDRAHRSSKWMDIGIPSLHNITSGQVSTKKKICWWILAVSSLPLHLCYNSVVFSSLSAQMYGIFQFTPSTAAAMANNTFVPQNYMTSEIDALSIYQSALRNPDLQRLSPLECINAYSQPFQAAHSNVFLILAEGETQEFRVIWEFSSIERSTGCGPSSGNRWMYQQFRDEDTGACFWQNTHIYLPRLQNNASDWRPWGGRVDHCMSEPAQPECRLQFSVYLLAIVMAFNAVKCVVILVAARGIKDKPLLTIGDAVATFLEREDETTKSIGWVEQQDILRAKKEYISVQNPTARPRKRHRWFGTVKRSLLIAATLSLSIAIIVLIALLAWGYTAILGSKSLSSVLSIRLGTLDQRMLIQSGTAGEGTAGIFQNVFLANAPQVIISLVYFSYNAAISSMLLASEWSGYSIVPKGLRVSSEPKGAQRSTYYFSLPLRYATPLLVMSTIIHWLASQSIFVVVVEAYNMFGFHSENTACYHFPGRRGSYTSRPRPDQVTDPRYCGVDFTTCGYSVLGILLTLVMAVVLAVALAGLGMKRIGGEMPVVGSNSIAIAANSQSRREWAHEENIFFTLQSRLKWSMAEGWRSTDHETVSLEQDNTARPETWSREWHQGDS